MRQEEFDSLVAEHEKWLESSEENRASNAPFGSRLIITGEKIRKISLAGRRLDHAIIHGADFVHSQFENCSFENSDLTGSKFREVEFRKCNFQNANLSSAVLIKASLDKADLTKAKLTGSDLNGAILHEANLAGGDLKRVSAKYTDFTGSRLNGANFENADLSKANVDNANALRASFKDSNLDGATFNGVNLNDTRFTGASMRLTWFDSKEQLAKLREKLTQDQLRSALFADEVNSKPIGDELGLLQVILDAQNITPINYSYLLVSLNAAYNNLLYITTTTDPIGKVRESMQPYYSSIDGKSDLQVKRIAYGSIVTDLAVYVSTGAAVLTYLASIIPKISAEVREFKKLPSKRRRQLEEESFEIDVRMKALDLEKKELELVRSRGQVAVPSEDGASLAHLEQIRENVDVSDAKNQLTYVSDEIANCSDELVRNSVSSLVDVVFKYREMGYSLTATYKGAPPQDD